MQSSEQLIICSPQEIHNTTIACSSESSSYPVHKDGFGYCCVPKNDEVNVTVNLTNEAGYESVEKASASNDELTNIRKELHMILSLIFFAFFFHIPCSYLSISI